MFPNCGDILHSTRRRRHAEAAKSAANPALIAARDRAAQTKPIENKQFYQLARQSH
jgi:hypothetical protein